MAAERSTVGFRMRAVGTNPDAARAAGMNVGATYLLTMALAGAWPAWPAR